MPANAHLIRRAAKRHQEERLRGPGDRPLPITTERSRGYSPKNRHRTSRLCRGGGEGGTPEGPEKVGKLNARSRRGPKTKGREGTQSSRTGKGNIKKNKTKGLGPRAWWKLRRGDSHRHDAWREKSIVGFSTLQSHVARNVSPPATLVFRNRYKARTRNSKWRKKDHPHDRNGRVC